MSTPASMLTPDPAPRRRRGRILPVVLLALAVGVAGAVGWTVAGRAVVDDIERVEGLTDVFSPPSPVVENYLLVGSDSRSAGDPNTGAGAEDIGSRSDSMMVLRYDKATGTGALLSIPRDLWVTVPGRDGKRKINAAFNDGPAVLVQTIQQNLFLPIHHYAEVDFVGFTELVDAVGGVTVCFPYPTRDLNTGLNIVEPGCVLLDGTQALAYTRSRYYEEFIDGEWRTDPTSDLGRTARQRAFVTATLDTAFQQVRANPFRAGQVVAAAGAAMSIDDGLDPIDSAVQMRRIVGGDLASYALPVRGDTVGDQSVLQLADGAGDVLMYFAGTAPAPPPPG